MRKTRRNLRKNRKSRRVKRGGAPRHNADDDLRKAHRYIYDYKGDKVPAGPPPCARRQQG
jgi:hypothetical protein